MAANRVVKPVYAALMFISPPLAGCRGRNAAPTVNSLGVRGWALGVLGM